MNLSFTWR